MSDFEDKLNKLLNDPDEMERFAGFAKSLMSGSAAEQPEPAPDMTYIPDFGVLRG